MRRHSKLIMTKKVLYYINIDQLMKVMMRMEREIDIVEKGQLLYSY